jgi:hypothetical protein
MRRTRHLLGAEITAVFPVLALTDGVGLAVGAMTWGQSLAIGLTADPALVPNPTLLAAEMLAVVGKVPFLLALLPGHGGHPRERPCAAARRHPHCPGW